MVLLMPLHESISEFVSQGLMEVNHAQISFGLKLLIFFGFFYLVNVTMKTGGSIIELGIYIIAFIKWIIYKIMKKDV